MNGLCHRLALSLLLMLAAAFALAAGAQEGEVAALPDSLGFSTNLIGVTLNLFLVLAAIVILAWVFKRAQGLGQPAAGSMRVTATLPLGPRERILLIEVGEEQIVVGASSGGLRTLHVLEHPLPLAPPTADDDSSFRDKLMKSLGRSA